MGCLGFPDPDSHYQAGLQKHRQRNLSSIRKIIFELFRTPVPGSKIVSRTAQERYLVALSEGVNNASFLLTVHFCNSRFPIFSSNVAMAMCLSFPLFYRGNRHDEASRPYR